LFFSNILSTFVSNKKNKRMEILIIVTHFFKVFILVLSLLIVVREMYHLFKSVKNKVLFDISNRQVLYLGLSISYVFAFIFG